MKRSLQGTFFALFLIAAVISLPGCKKSSDSLPVQNVLTNPIISNLTSTSIYSGGASDQAGANTANGVCWSSTNQTPTIADAKTTDTLSIRWVSRVTGLTPNTTYYLRAYSTTIVGTGYGAVITFTTNATSATLQGTVTTLAGSTGGANGFADGTGNNALFDGPQNIAFNKTNGLLYVSDAFNNAIRTVTTGGTVTTINKQPVGYLNGSLASAQFYGPRGLSFDAAGNAYIADIGNNTIRKITTAGVVSTYAGNTSAGYIDGAAANAEFYNPEGTTTDAAGNVYVADRTNNLIRKITPAGVVSLFAGFQVMNGYQQSYVIGFYDGDVNVAQFYYPIALAADGSGNIYVADYSNNAIRKVNSAGNTTTYVGGPNFPKLISGPTAVAVDATGNVFFTDSSGRVFEVTTQKVLIPIAGSQNNLGYVDGVGAAAKFNKPTGITIDAQGNLYVTDAGNNVIRKIVVKLQ